jgi:hypothetical protein
LGLGGGYKIYNNNAHTYINKYMINKAMSSLQDEWQLIINSFWQYQLKIYFHRPEDKLRWVIQQLREMLPKLNSEQRLIVNFLIKIIGEVRGYQKTYVQKVSFEFDDIYRSVFDFVEVRTFPLPIHTCHVYASTMT